MSFVERHKLWLLPVLAAGVAAVGWFNYQSFTGSKPAVAATSGDPQPAEPTAAPPSPPAPSLSTPEPAPAGSGGVWDDLKALAVVPADWNRLDSLDTQARAPLPVASLREGPGDLIRLAGPRMREAQNRPRPSGSGEAPPSAPPPDILIQLPEGSRVWFDGVGYRERQELGRAPWRVRKIYPRAVELQGPGGTEVKSIHPAPKPESKEGP